MCGRYTYLLTWDDIRHLYSLTAQGAEDAGGGGGGGASEEAPPDFRRRYNHAPTERAPVVRIKDGRRELVMLRWGWGKPSWSPTGNGSMPAARGSRPRAIMPIPSGCGAA